MIGMNEWKIKMRNERELSKISHTYAFYVVNAKCSFRWKKTELRLNFAIAHNFMRCIEWELEGIDNVPLMSHSRTCFYMKFREAFCCRCFTIRRHKIIKCLLFWSWIFEFFLYLNELRVISYFCYQFLVGCKWLFRPNMLIHVHFLLQRELQTRLAARISWPHNPFPVCDFSWGNIDNKIVLFF